MTDERRNEARYVASWPAVLRLADGDVQAICTSLSASGAFVECEVAGRPGDVLNVSLQPRRASRPDVELQGEIVYAVHGGGRRSAGLGLRWLPPQDIEPLHVLLRVVELRAARDERSSPRDTMRELSESGITALEQLVADVDDGEA